MYPYLNLGHGILISLYNLFIGIGIIFGLLYLERSIRLRKIKFLTDRNIYFSLIASILLGFLGAKIFDLIFLGKAISLHNLYSGGITFMGGVMTSAIIFLLINFLLKTNNLFALNLLSPSLILAHFFGRIGCFLGGCCYGKPTTFFLGVKYPSESLTSIHLGNQTYSHPTQLYEAIFLIIFFMLIEKYCSFQNKISVYLIGYGIFRFFLEFLRFDDRGEILNGVLSPSQIISCLFVIIGIILILIIRAYPPKSYF